MKRVLRCWLLRHTFHGVYYDTPAWLPNDSKPETYDEGAAWVRAPWLDRPASPAGKFKIGRMIEDTH
jgi:hypothetical protein